MPPPRPVTDVATAYADAQRHLTAEALAALQPAMRRGRASPEAWRDAIASAAPALLAAQGAAVSLAEPYLDQVLPAQGASTTAEATINPAGFTDLTDGGGSWMHNLIYAPISVRQQAGLAASVAQARAALVAMSIVVTGMQDIARSAVQTSMFTRPAVTGYVRMLRPPSCARCAILAGRVYRSVVAFHRHPRCDCVHVPIAEDAGDWATNPVTYFRSLSAVDQDRIFTRGGARAIRDSGYSQVAMNQIVNARQGIRTVTAYGRELRVTTVGTTRRATFGGYEVLPSGELRRRADSELQKLPSRRYRTAKAPRLMPDEIYTLAEEFGWDRAEVLRQLRRFAYITT